MSKPGQLTIPLNLMPISKMTDEEAGEYAFVSDGETFGLAKLKDGAWFYPGNIPLDIAPTHYRPAGRIIAPRGDVG